MFSVIVSICIAVAILGLAFVYYSERKCRVLSLIEELESGENARVYVEGCVCSPLPGYTGVIVDGFYGGNAYETKLRYLKQLFNGARVLGVECGYIYPDAEVVRKCGLRRRRKILMFVMCNGVYIYRVGIREAILRAYDVEF